MIVLMTVLPEAAEAIVVRMAEAGIAVPPLAEEEAEAEEEISFTKSAQHLDW